MRYVLIFSVAAVAVGCGSGGSNYEPTPVKPVPKTTVKPGAETELFPLAVGNQWTYTGETNQRIQGRVGTGSFEMTFKVVKVTPKGDGVVADLEVTTNTPNSKKDMQRWERNAKGIYQTAVGNPMVPFNPPQPIVLFPADEGRKWEWKGTGVTPAGRSGSNMLKSEVLPAQEVDAATERFSAICVSSKGTFGIDKANGQVASMSYWSPGVGLVRYRQEVAVGQNVGVQVLKLKARTIR